MSDDLLISIFCGGDDFCASFEPLFAKTLLSRRRYLTRKQRLQLSELMTLMVVFHLSKFRTFKDFYTCHNRFLRSYFPALVSWARLAALTPWARLSSLLLSLFYPAATDWHFFYR